MGRFRTSLYELFRRYQIQLGDGVKRLQRTSDCRLCQFNSPTIDHCWRACRACHRHNRGPTRVYAKTQASTDATLRLLRHGSLYEAPRLYRVLNVNDSAQLSEFATPLPEDTAASYPVSSRAPSSGSRRESRLTHRAAAMAGEESAVRADRTFFALRLRAFADLLAMVFQ